MSTESAASHLQELAVFLAVHQDRAPGILWPEYEHPACRPRARGAVLDRMADGLAELVHRPVRISSCAGGLSASGGPAAAHQLVVQTAGGGDWSLRSAPGSAVRPPFRCRLRAGEVLYIPPHSPWRASFFRASPYLLITVDPHAAAAIDGD